MILIDVSIPSLRETDNFEIDEREPIGEIIEEILELAAAKSRTEVPAAREFLLTEPAGGRIFDPAKTPAEYGIANGAALLLL